MKDKNEELLDNKILRLQKIYVKIVARPMRALKSFFRGIRQFLRMIIIDNILGSIHSSPLHPLKSI